jgi:hypothetical protein
MLLPVVLFLGWGPVTHPYINLLALKRAEQEAALGNPKVNRGLLARLKRRRSHFIFGANSADSIANLHVMTGTPVYDYAHNYIPDSVTGRPVFGHRLIREWFEAREGGPKSYPEEDLAVACAWLAHQLADWYSHYAVVDSKGLLLPEPFPKADGKNLFSGYANSHRVLGADFCPEILRAYRQIDHALIEFLHDLLISYYDQEGLFNTSRVDFFAVCCSGSGAYNLLTDASERFRGAAARISPNQLVLLKDNLRTTIKGLRLLINLLFLLRPGLPESIQRELSPRTTGGPDYVKLSVENVLNGLFCKTIDEMTLGSHLPYNKPLDIYTDSYLVREVTKPGTLLFRVAHRLGKFLPEVLLQPCRQSEQLSLRFLRVFELRGRILNQLLAGFSQKILEVFTDDIEENALLSFIGLLLKETSPDFEAARARFRMLLPPFVKLAGADHLSEEERLTLMLNDSEICVRAVPAIPFNDPNRRLKILDMNTLQFCLDGYDILGNAHFSNWSAKDNEFGLNIRARLKETITEGYHRLSVALKDRYGVSARPLERDFWVDPGIKVQILG